jgi:hypothetical protein
MAVKGARSLRVHRSEAQTLDGHRRAGYAARAQAYREAQQNQRVYAMAVHGGFSVYERKRQGRGKNLSGCHATSLRT